MSLEQEFIDSLQGLANSVQFAILTERVIKKCDELWCVVRKEDFEVADGNNIVRSIIYTAKSYGIERNDVIQILDEDGCPTTEIYTVGPNTSTNPLKYEAILDTIEVESEEGEDSEVSVVLPDSVIYGAAKDILKGSDNITLTPDDEAQTITIAGEAGGVIADGSIDTDQLADDAVTEIKLDDPVAARLLPSSLGTAGQVLTVNGAADGVGYESIPEVSIADGSIGSDQLAANAVTEAKIKDKAVTSGKLEEGAVDTLQLADGAVTKDELAANAVTEAKINGGAVTEGKLADNAVTESKIKDGAVDTDKLADKAVVRAKIGDNAVGDGQVGANAITGAKIKDGAVDADKLASAVTARLLPSSLGTANQVLQVNSAANGVEYATPDDGGITINYRSIDISTNDNNWHIIVQSSEYNENYIFTITLFVSDDNFGGVTFRGKDLGASAEVYTRATRDSVSIRIENGAIEVKFKDNNRTAKVTCVWTPQTITVLS